MMTMMLSFVVDSVADIEKDHLLYELNDTTGTAMVTGMVLRTITDIATGAFSESSVRTLHITDMEAWCRIRFAEGQWSHPRSWGSVLLIIFYVENLDVESWGVKNDV